MLAYSMNEDIPEEHDSPKIKKEGHLITVKPKGRADIVKFQRRIIYGDLVQLYLSNLIGFQHLFKFHFAKIALKMD